jgi:putative hydrolases of HD superfamily
MQPIANILFEMNQLKKTARSGFAFLGAGEESVADHSFAVAFIAMVMTKMEPSANPLRLISMCLVHDLPEARIGDLNSVQKRYVSADETRAVLDMSKDSPLGDTLVELMDEFNQGESIEAQLSGDADQLALLIELKSLLDCGYTSPQKWLPHVRQRIRTQTGRQIAEQILQTDRDAWWLNPGSE